MINVRNYFSRIQGSIGGAIPSGVALFVVMFFYWIQQPLIHPISVSQACLTSRLR